MSTIAAYRAANTRAASVVTVGGFRPTGRPDATHFGLVPLAGVDEKWPTARDGTLLRFVCQLNIADAPFTPACLADIKLLTFFVHPEEGLLAEENNINWSVRAYRTLQRLAPLAVPSGCGLPVGFECAWSQVSDYPKYDDPDLIVPEGFDNSEIHLENVHRTKIGGYASNIQSEPWWGYRAHPSGPMYCLQIDSEEKAGLVWGDGGTVYIARGTTRGCSDEWFLDWQSY